MLEKLAMAFIICSCLAFAWIYGAEDKKQVVNIIGNSDQTPELSMLNDFMQSDTQPERLKVADALLMLARAPFSWTRDAISNAARLALGPPLCHPEDLQLGQCDLEANEASLLWRLLWIVMSAFVVLLVASLLTFCLVISWKVYAKDRSVTETAEPWEEEEELEPVVIYMNLDSKIKQQKTSPQLEHTTKTFTFDLSNESGDEGPRKKTEGGLTLFVERAEKQLKILTRIWPENPRVEPVFVNATWKVSYRSKEGEWVELQHLKAAFKKDSRDEVPITHQCTSWNVFAERVENIASAEFMIEVIKHEICETPELRCRSHIFDCDLSHEWTKWKGTAGGLKLSVERFHESVAVKTRVWPDHVKAKSVLAVWKVFLRRNDRWMEIGSYAGDVSKVGNLEEDCTEDFARVQDKASVQFKITVESCTIVLDTAKMGLHGG